ncbi:helix-turn-helix domain-containing protein [Teichococcus oryzae]|uniref:helix-turn-helix domain-containing protein n=1 Tax=Teichococcus oryzae TaxID=1608942 RepID=UPI0019D64E05|nr:AraC family transcriptional regulator [Pseudoroseomonas oryzae]
MTRELHFWFLAGRHGAAIRQLGWPGGHVQQVSRAVAMLRARFAEPLRVESLAATAGMSLSCFHQHFRSVTSFSPLHFQKQLCLIEARRLMMAEGHSPSGAAFAVGYESAPQFAREYSRMFGLPPARDARAARRCVEAPAGSTQRG